MEVYMVIRMIYDPAKDGSLKEFRTKKWLPFRAHIDRLQAAGTLPRGEIRWVTEKKRPEAPKPDGPTTPAMVVQFQRPSRPVSPYGVPLPMLVHVQGTRMDPERIAI